MHWLAVSEERKGPNRVYKTDNGRFVAIKKVNHFLVFFADTSPARRIANNAIHIGSLPTTLECFKLWITHGKNLIKSERIIEHGKSEAIE